MGTNYASLLDDLHYMLIRQISFNNFSRMTIWNKPKPLIPSPAKYAMFIHWSIPNSAIFLSKPLGLLATKDLSIIWLSNLFILSVPDDVFQKRVVRINFDIHVFIT